MNQLAFNPFVKAVVENEDQWIRHELSMCYDFVDRLRSSVYSRMTTSEIGQNAVGWTHESESRDVDQVINLFSTFPDRIVYLYNVLCHRYRSKSMVSFVLSSSLVERPMYMIPMNLTNGETYHTLLVPETFVDLFIGEACFGGRLMLDVVERNIWRCAEFNERRLSHFLNMSIDALTFKIPNRRRLELAKTLLESKLDRKSTTILVEIAQGMLAKSIEL